MASAFSSPSPDTEIDITAPSTYVDVFNKYFLAYIHRAINGVDSDEGKRTLTWFRDQWKGEKRQSMFTKHVDNAIVKEIKQVVSTSESKDVEIASLHSKIKKERAAAIQAGKLMKSQSSLLLNYGAPTPKRKRIDDIDSEVEESDDEPSPKRLKKDKKDKKDKTAKKIRDENMPKKPVTSFMAYVRDHREEARAKLLAALMRTPHNGEIMKELGAMWTKVSTSDDAADEVIAKKYKDISDLDKKRFVKEMKTYVRPSDEVLLKMKADKKLNKGKKAVEIPAVVAKQAEKTATKTDESSSEGEVEDGEDEDE